MNHWLRSLFFLLIVKPLVVVVLGTNIKHGQRLPRKGPAMLVANHNSHLDTFVLMSLYPLRELSRIRPVAAADYFFRYRLLSWFALRIVGIIPLDREHTSTKRANPIAPCLEALDHDEILLLFPEGTRGEPEQMTTFKSGVAHLMKCRPDVPAVPIFMHGLGKALPRGEALLVPNICDISIGEPLHWLEDKASTMGKLEHAFQELQAERHKQEEDYDREEYSYD